MLHVSSPAIKSFMNTYHRVNNRDGNCPTSRNMKNGSHVTVNKTNPECTVNIPLKDVLFDGETTKTNWQAKLYTRYDKVIGHDFHNVTASTQHHTV
jgi:hypothetical protein